MHVTLAMKIIFTHITRTQDIWEFTREVVVYNLATNQWTPINQMNQKRFGLTMEVLNGKLTVFGGIQRTRKRSHGRI